MFNNIFKKFGNKANQDPNLGPASGGTSNGVGPNGSVQRMGQHLQKKFARGIQYNMKIIIRGDRNVGKTALFHRLQGEKFKEEYVASDEIQVTSIQWNYNATDDVVKVEIWDVVDKANKKRDPRQASSLSGKEVKLKMGHTSNPTPVPNGGPKPGDPKPETPDPSSPALDAEFVDVYKGTHGLVLLFDMTKLWTFEYVQRELRRAPVGLPVLILANHRDMGHHRVVTADQVQGMIDTLLAEDAELGRARAEIRHAEASMRNGFGLRYLYKFFNLPYLHLQRQTLLKQLERNLGEITGSVHELDALADSDEHNYDLFLDMITSRRRQAADSLSAVKKVNDSGSVIPVARVTPNGVTSTNGAVSKSTSMPSGLTNGNGLVVNGVSRENGGSQAPMAKPTPSIIIGAKHPLPAKFQAAMQQQSKSQQQKKSPSVAKSQTMSSLSSQGPPRATLGPVRNIDDFVPEESDTFRQFLDDANVHLPHVDPLAGGGLAETDSEDEDLAADQNPMVARYQEELDSEDEAEMAVYELQVRPQVKKAVLDESKEEVLVDDEVLVAEEVIEAEEQVLAGEEVIASEEMTSSNVQDPRTVQTLDKSPEIDDQEAVEDQEASPVQDLASVLEEEDEEPTELGAIPNGTPEPTPVLEPSGLTQLNCDDIDALESLYISGGNSRNLAPPASNGYLGVVDDASSETSSVTSKKGGGKAKKSRKTKETTEGTTEGKTKKSRKTTSSGIKVRNSKTKKQTFQEDETEAERRQLEAFLGGPLVEEEEGPAGKRDLSAYETL